MIRGIARITAAAALIVGAGAVHGKWTGRWGPSPALAALAARFDSVPAIVGGWDSAPAPLGDRERQAAGAAACLSRVYTDRARGVSVSVLLLGGLPGNIAAHTPDVCYPSVGYKWTAARRFEHRPKADGKAAEFQTALAAREGASPSVVRIFWAWRTPAGWAAPEDVRWRFASEPTLCKLYIVRQTGGAAVDPELDPCNDFLDAFLPELERAVFPEAPPVAGGPRAVGGPAPPPG